MPTLCNPEGQCKDGLRFACVYLEHTTCTKTVIVGLIGFYLGSKLIRSHADQPLRSHLSLQNSGSQLRVAGITQVEGQAAHFLPVLLVNGCMQMPHFRSEKVQPNSRLCLMSLMYNVPCSRGRQQRFMFDAYAAFQCRCSKHRQRHVCLGQSTGLVPCINHIYNPCWL